MYLYFYIYKSLKNLIYAKQVKLSVQKKIIINNTSEKSKLKKKYYIRKRQHKLSQNICRKQIKKMFIFLCLEILLKMC